MLPGKDRGTARILRACLGLQIEGRGSKRVSHSIPIRPRILLEGVPGPGLRSVFQDLWLRLWQARLWPQKAGIGSLPEADGAAKATDRRKWV